MEEYFYCKVVCKLPDSNKCKLQWSTAMPFEKLKQQMFDHIRNKHVIATTGEVYNTTPQSQKKNHKDINVNDYVDNFLSHNYRPGQGVVNIEEEEEGYQEIDDSPGQVAGKDRIINIRKRLDKKNMVGNKLVFENFEAFHHEEKLDPSHIVSRFRRLEEVCPKKMKQFKFFCQVMHLSVGAGSNQIQQAIDLEYSRQVETKDIKIEDIRCPRIRQSVKGKERLISVEAGPATGWLQTGSRALSFSARKTLVKVLGEFLNLFQVEIAVPKTLKTKFYFVDPIPLCLLNLRSRKMLKNLEAFNKRSNDDAMYLNSKSKRSSGRLGSNIESIMLQHYNRGITDKRYSNSSPLLIRVFQDAAKVSDHSQNSVTPILMSIGNLHPDLQVQLPSKTIIGYFPRVRLSKGTDKPETIEHAGIRQQIWHVIMGEIIECFEQYHIGNGITMSYPGGYEKKSRSIQDKGFIERKFFPYICGQDIDGPERYKCAVLYGQGCPRCIVPHAREFCSPLSPENKRTEKDSIASYRAEKNLVKEVNDREESDKAKKKSLKIISEGTDSMLSKLMMRPIWNCFWNRKCVPVGIYELISTDVLHEYPQGIVKRILEHLKFGLNRAKFNTGQNDVLFFAQVEECRYFNAPRYQIVKKNGEDDYVAIDPYNNIRVRKLEASVVRDEMRLTAGTSITSWIYMSTIVMGYGDQASLRYQKNDLFHFRIAMNCLFKLLKELETTEVNYNEEWGERVDNLVQGVHLVLEDPHVSPGSKTEKMHRMLHLVQNFKDNGIFKVSNLSHYERSHSYFSKHVYAATGKDSREYGTTGPNMRMLLYVLMDMLMSVVSNPEDDLYGDDEDDSDQEDNSNEHEVTDEYKGSENPYEEEPDGQDADESNKGSENSNEEEADGQDADESSKAAGIIMHRDYMSMSSVFKATTSTIRFRSMYNDALKGWEGALRQWEKKNFGDADLVYSTPCKFNEAKMYLKLTKDFKLSSRTEPEATTQTSLDGRGGLVYSVGDCIVLEQVMDNTMKPQYALIHAFVESSESIRGTKHETKKHFVLVENLRSAAENAKYAQRCKYCTTEHKQTYESSNCNNDCDICFVVEKQTTKEQSDLTDEEKATFEKFNFKIPAMYDKTIEVTVNKKPSGHDGRMMEFVKKNKDIYKIPFVHYHGAGYDLVESPGIVTKVLMIKDVRAKNLSYFYVPDPLHNM